MPKVDISIVTWNSEKEIVNLLESLSAQTFLPDNIYVIDNASNDRTIEICEKYSNVTLIVQNTNIGYAAAHNIAIRKSKADFILVINPDVVLKPDYIKILVDFAIVSPKHAAFVGNVYRNFQESLIDTTGLQIKPWRITRDRIIQEIKPHEVFGISGAVALYRKSALEDVKVNDQYFNELYFAYKEDIEIAWRLRWAGWLAINVPAAKAQHSRNISTRKFLKDRPSFQRKLSYRNHLLLYASVENFQTLLLDLWAVIPAELIRLFVLLLRDTSITLQALAEVVKMWHSARTFAKGTISRVPARTLRAAFRL